MAVNTTLIDSDKQCNGAAKDNNGLQSTQHNNSIPITHNVLAVLHGPEDIRMEERPFAYPGPGEVTVKVVATGLCGSDLHYYRHGRNGDFSLQHPMCLGHESSGNIVSIGAGVADSFPHLTCGTRVVVEPGLNCVSCKRCLEGRYNLCETLRFASSAKTHPHLDGTLQRYFTWPARLVHVLPSNVTYHAAALIEPLAVVLQALSRAGLSGGQSVLIYGAGAVGLLACAASKSFGASYVAAADIDEDRLRFARHNNWVDNTILLDRGGSNRSPSATSNGDNDKKSRAEQRKAEDEADMANLKAKGQEMVQHLAQSTDDPSSTSFRSGFDVVLECTGVPSCVSLSIFTARPGAKVILVGMGFPIMTLPLAAAALREVDILGVFRYANMFPRAIQLLSGGALPAVGRGVRASSQGGGEGEGTTGGRGGVENIISHIYPLGDSKAAFEAMKRGKGEDGRSVVKVFVVDDDG